MFLEGSKTLFDAATQLTAVADLTIDLGWGNYIKHTSALIKKVHLREPFERLNVLEIESIFMLAEYFNNSTAFDEEMHKHSEA